jgi:outer membrane receptor protein involved in Fe transport
MSVNFTDFATPRRYTWLNAFAAKWERDRWLLSAQILGTLTFEQVKTGEAAPDRHKLTPSFSFSYRLSRDESLRLRMFYKQNYRLPTFNDLYYQRSGNTNLKPEDASQWNAGLVFSRAFPGKIQQISFSADGYYNRVKNKILAVPRHNLFLWSMSNIGTVEISGLDVVAESVIKPSENWSLVLGGGYTYQRAVDLSDPEGNTYKHQIPYTPRHSGSARLALVLPWVDIAYTCFWSGERYILKQNIPENRLPGYAEQGVSVRKTLMVGKVSSVLQAEVLNITDKTYEVVKSYPMPGRHFRLGLTVEL